MPFTARQVNALRPKAARYEVPEPGRTGLAIRVTPNGAKTWAFRYRFHDTQHRMIFGTYPDMSVADARLKLADAKKKLDAGIDPGALEAEHRHAERTAGTIGQIAEAYIAYAGRTFRPATVREDTRIITREILPVWRHRRAKDITRRDVMQLLNAIETRGVYVMRNRVAGVLSRFFFYAVDQGHVDASPAFNIKRLKKVGQKEVERRRKRFLSCDEIRSFWFGLDRLPITAAMRAALRWALVTGQRRGELAGAMREEIDETAGVWRIPASRTKGDRDQVLPLPKLAIQILAEADRARIRPQPVRLNRMDRRPYDPMASVWMFPSSRHDRPITPGALTCAIVRHRKTLGIGDASVHDLRRTFATHHGELGTPPDILSALLSHAPATLTKAVYDQSTGLEPKRRAMEVWSAWLERVLAGEESAENVVSIATAGRRVG